MLGCDLSRSFPEWHGLLPPNIVWSLESEKKEITAKAVYGVHTIRSRPKPQKEASALPLPTQQNNRRTVRLILTPLHHLQHLLIDLIRSCHRTIPENLFLLTTPSEHSFGGLTTDWQGIWFSNHREKFDFERGRQLFFFTSSLPSHLPFLFPPLFAHFTTHSLAVCRT